MLARSIERSGLPFRPETRQRLVGLMLGRLLLSLVGLAIVVVLDGVGIGPRLPELSRLGLYWTLGFAFLATVASGLAFQHVRSARRFAAVQLAVDVAIVTLLVVFSGGHESVFSFLYVAVTAYGSLLFERRGALAVASACAVAYGAALGLERVAVVAQWLGEGVPVHPAVAASTWGLHVAAFFLVGALASVLTGELRRTGAALDRSAHDLRRLRDLNARVVQSLESGLLTTDAAGRIASFNPEAERITGVRAIDVIGQPIDEVIPGTWSLMKRARRVRGAPVRRQRLAYRTREGVARHLDMAASRLRDDAGDALGYVLIFQDVSDVVEMETELTRRERLAAAGELSARIAHEIRNPLAAISGSVQVLRAEWSGGPSGEEPGRLMDIVVREAERLSALITDFLGYARPRPPECKELRLDELAEEVVCMLEAGGPEGVTFEVVREGVQPGPVEVVADAAQLRQLLWNLCSNALQAMPEGGRLRVRVGDAPQEMQAPDRSEQAEGGAAGGDAVAAVDLVVEDSGAGIPPEHLERLFEPFFTTRSGGTGLGLATVHRIVEGHAGELMVDSTQAQGTRIRVRLPKHGAVR